MSFLKRILSSILGQEDIESSVEHEQSVDVTPTIAPRIAILQKPSLEGVAYALRHPGVWPRGFYWNYSTCHHCAIALAFALWPKIKEIPGYGIVGKDYNRFHLSAVARVFSIPHDDARNIFFDAEDVDGPSTIKKENVTPEMVAKVIDAYIANYVVDAVESADDSGQTI